MAMTNAERQKKYRAAQRKKGLVRKDSWTDLLGFIAPTKENGGWQTMTLKDLNKGLENLLAGFKGDEKEIVYAEVFEYAKRVIDRFEKRFYPKK
jgi:hypothetical protein